MSALVSQFREPSAGITGAAPDRYGEKGGDGVWSMRWPRSVRTRRGLTMVEVTISLIILGVAITAGVRTLGSFATSSKAWAERSVAMELANALMSEITTLPFADPDGGNVIGCDPGETAADRTTFDDIDDYHGWEASPPQDASGTALTAYSGFRQQVAVAYDDALGEPLAVDFEAGTFKKITVTISKDNKVLARLVPVRARQADVMNGSTIGE